MEGRFKPNSGGGSENHWEKTGIQVCRWGLVWAFLGFGVGGYEFLGAVFWAGVVASLG